MQELRQNVVKGKQSGNQKGYLLWLLAQRTTEDVDYELETPKAI